jgi:hypothetical protein
MVTAGIRVGVTVNWFMAASLSVVVWNKLYLPGEITCNLLPKIGMDYCSLMM